LKKLELPHSALCLRAGPTRLRHSKGPCSLSRGLPFGTVIASTTKQSHKENTINIFVFPKKKYETFRVYQVYFSDKSWDSGQAEEVARRLAVKLFVDPVCEILQTSNSSVQQAVLCGRHRALLTPNSFIVWFKDGVYDAQGEMAFFGAQKLGLADGVERIKFGRGFLGAKRGAGNEEYFNPLVETLEKL